MYKSLNTNKYYCDDNTSQGRIIIHIYTLLIIILNHEMYDCSNVINIFVSDCTKLSIIYQVINNYADKFSFDLLKPP